MLILGHNPLYLLRTLSLLLHKRNRLLRKKLTIKEINDKLRLYIKMFSCIYIKIYGGNK